MKHPDFNKQLIFFLTGFIVGVLFIFFTGDKLRNNTEILSVQSLMQITYIDLLYSNYLLYLIKKRVSIGFVMSLAALTVAGKYLLLGLIMYYGVSIGCMLSIAVMRYGLKGILLFLALVFPQDLFYIPALYQLVQILMRVNYKIFGNGSILTIKDKRGLKGEKILYVLGVTIIGLLLECYVNPFIVKIILKLF